MFLVIVIGGGNIYYAEQKRADCKLRAALEENVTLAAVAERERIARDLHDVLGHTLSVIVLKSELAGRLVPLDPARAVVEMEDVERTARSALSEIREAIGGYRSRGLTAEIDLARLTLDTAGVALVAESSPDRGAFSPQEETALALALREAVTNIVRHAGATTCSVRFVDEGGHRSLVVEDDGQNAVVREGNGLRGMRERIESLGGQFSLESGVARNRGTRLTIELPHRETHGVMTAPPRAATPIRVLIAEDQTMLRDALAALLALEPDITVVAQAANGREALKLARLHTPDVVITDIEMPERGGLELADDLKNIASGPHVIILTTFARPGYLRRALETGARGYLLKDRPASELADAVRRVHSGSAPSTQHWPPKPGAAMKILSLTASAKYCIEPAMVARPQRLPPNCASLKAPYATTFQRPLPNSAPPIVLMPHESLEHGVGFSSPLIWIAAESGRIATTITDRAGAWSAAFGRLWPTRILPLGFRTGSSTTSRNPVRHLCVMTIVIFDGWGT